MKSAANDVSFAFLLLLALNIFGADIKSESQHWVLSQVTGMFHEATDVSEAREFFISPRANSE